MKEDSEIIIKVHGTAIYRAVKNYMSNPKSDLYKKIDASVEKEFDSKIKNSIWWKFSNPLKKKKGEYDSLAEAEVIKFIKLHIKEQMESELEAFESTIEKLVKKHIKKSLKEMLG